MLNSLERRRSCSDHTGFALLKQFYSLKYKGSFFIERQADFALKQYFSKGIHPEIFYSRSHSLHSSLDQLLLYLRNENGRNSKLSIECSRSRSSDRPDSLRDNEKAKGHERNAQNQTIIGLERCDASTHFPCVTLKQQCEWKLNSTTICWASPLKQVE